VVERELDRAEIGRFGFGRPRRVAVEELLRRAERAVRAHGIPVRQQGADVEERPRQLPLRTRVSDRRDDAERRVGEDERGRKSFPNRSAGISSSTLLRS
jgi:hypothetical protein